MKQKQLGRTLLHCAIDPTTSFPDNLLNCSASGKKRAGMIMLERLKA